MFLTSCGMPAYIVPKRPSEASSNNAMRGVRSAPPIADSAMAVVFTVAAPAPVGPDDGPAFPCSLAIHKSLPLLAPARSCPAASRCRFGTGTPRGLDLRLFNCLARTETPTLCHVNSTAFWAWRGMRG